ncbi:MAG: Nucleotide sugar dehydrogenase [Candidatus Moranbacteria bacterium GW2011_GWE2_35_2-]|nr:MAG: Nucleotide sugar dehydrogenase [Candidatus Moranbacteria bacterium GW2011_GWE2_35_2-]KKQ06098.1 MAG: Nucleotide sugar dehydrogenase [Candidatus Moranbacteria bacterium GW2011_GWF1_36_4]KKQ22848.1 MAG: Nucleotide sugar dehydrogenase [Candidatus Moranbacteria bacterium GW2011_GWF2_37_11]KKQ28639.1 MAG: Nucleotide sugar dehydrogenase [Candidatus Moranbacteria bacterium GW2011_GWD1_37_17]KKQ30921.1 MAG: Nucleotide sugar dehydrogenase [Candidatus Moranbacteria bacterium GW2011_GWE1_37_24]KK
MKKNNVSTKKVCIIGLGYVGLPLAVQSALKGFEVFGLDMDESKIKKIQAGKSPIDEEFLHENLPKVNINATTNEKVIQKADIILVCVPTPIDKMFFPDLGPVRGAVAAIIRNFKKGQLVIIESTINPGVCEEVVEPMFAEAGYKVGKDYEMAHCPERINPGDPKWNVTNIPRVVGSFTQKGLEEAKKFYETIIENSIYPMKSIREAEAVKVVENSFRDINIAFVNELAKSFDKMGIDVKDVIAGASTKPFAFMPHWPSCGVGGHCIPVDPYYLIERAKLSGFDHEFLKIARKINNSMPLYTVELLHEELNNIKKPLNGTRVGILGLSYKANVDDLRETPALKVIEEIKKHKAKVEIFDPYFPKMSTVKSIEELLKKSEAVVLVTDHKVFKEIDPKIFKKHKIKVLIDGKNCLSKKDFEKQGVVYKGIGR